MSEDFLKQILEEMKSMNNRLERLETSLQDTQSQMNSRFDTVGAELSLIKASVNRIEENQPEDIVGMMKNINSKLQKVSDHDTDIRLIKQILTNQ